MVKAERDKQALAVDHLAGFPGHSSHSSPETQSPVVDGAEPNVQKVEQKD